MIAPTGPSRRLLLGIGGGGVASLVTASTLAQPAARLSLNENPWGPSPNVAPAILAALSRINRYVEDEPGALISQIAALERVAG